MVIHSRSRKPLQGAAEKLLKAKRSTLAPSSRKWIKIVFKPGTSENGVACRFHIQLPSLVVATVWYAEPFTETLKLSDDVSIPLESKCTYKVALVVSSIL
jgi:hypothetical protein